MAGLFGLGGAGTAVLIGVLVLGVVAVVSPPGRRAAAAGLGAVGRWPGLIRAELRGAAPLEPERPLGDTTPDIPVVPPEAPGVTRGSPVVEHSDRT